MDVDESPTEIKTEEWSAYINIMPPGPATFHAACTLVLPTGGFQARLEPARPQGINSSVVLLNLIVTPSESSAQNAGVASETRIPIRYADHVHTDFKTYHKVAVLYLGRPVADINIEIVM